jgi:hypothetical protein
MLVQGPYIGLNSAFLLYLSLSGSFKEDSKF